jgi:hypothetical protein
MYLFWIYITLKVKDITLDTNLLKKDLLVTLMIELMNLELT